MLAVLLAQRLTLDAQVAKPPSPLTVEEVVQLNKEGFSEEVIITKIRKNGKAFDLSTDELVELRKIGVSDNVIKFLLDPSQPYVPPAPPPPPQPAAPPVNRPEPPPAPVVPSQPAKQYPPEPNASKVPPEPGLYRFPGDAPIKIDVKLLLGSGGKRLTFEEGKGSSLHHWSDRSNTDQRAVCRYFTFAFRRERRSKRLSWSPLSGKAIGGKLKWGRPEKNRNSKPKRSGNTMPSKSDRNYSK